MADKSIDVDWERIEIDYRAGILTLREIASQHKISHVAVNKHAKKEKWPRDLNAKIKARAEALVTKQMVTNEVNSDKVISENQAVEAYALAISTVQFEHKTTLAKLKNHATKVLEELELTGDNVEELRHLAELLIDTSDDADVYQSKRLDTLNKVISLSSRIDSFKKLTETLKIIIGLEREAFGLDKEIEKKSQELTNEQLEFKLANLLRKAGVVSFDGGQTIQ